MNNQPTLTIQQIDESNFVEVTHCANCNRKAWINPNEPYAFVPSTVCNPPPNGLPSTLDVPLPPSFSLVRQYANSLPSSTLDVPLPPSLERQYQYVPSFYLDRQYNTLSSSSSSSALDILLDVPPPLYAIARQYAESLDDESLVLDLPPRESTSPFVYYNPDDIAEYVANLPALPPLIPDKDQDKEDEKLKL